MKKFIVILVFFGTGLSLPAEMEVKMPLVEPLFTWDLLWSGSWEADKNLANRLDMHFRFPVPGLVLRSQIVDRRPAKIESFRFVTPEKESFYGFGGGLYHNPTGSRLLYGILDEWGLSARLRNPWIRGLPYVENHKPLMADLKTDPSSTKIPEAYLYLGSPQWGIFRGFALAQVTPVEWETNPCPAFGGGIEALFKNKAALQVDSFFSERILPPRKSSTWFSETPPLPERETQLGALSLLFTMPHFALSSDWAYSETFAWGRDIYGNLGLRFNGNFPVSKKMAISRWTASLAADGAGEHYISREGSSPGAGFRSAGKFEWQGGRNRLALFSTSLRAPAMGENFDRSSTTLYYRFPFYRAGKGEINFPLRMTRVSLTVDRNAADFSKILDSLDASLGLSLTFASIDAPLGISFSGSVKGLSAWEAGTALSPYPFPQYPTEFNSAKAAGELSWSPRGTFFKIPGTLQLKTRLGYEVTAKKDPVWDTSFSVSARVKQSRLSVKIASPKFPEKWDYTVSWRAQIERPVGIKKK